MAKAPVFDGHNDSVQLLPPTDQSNAAPFLEGKSSGHVDLPRARKGNFSGGLFALFVEPDPETATEHDRLTVTESGYHVSTPPAIRPAHAQRVTDELLERLTHLVSSSNGQVRIVESVEEIRAGLREEVMSIVIHFEGAAAIDPSLGNLEQYYETGLRSLGLVWSRPNAFGTGVPFQYPASPDTGPGLTDAGRELVRDCNDLGIVVDFAHINEQGFWDAASVTTDPVVVSHAGVHSICPSTRNLSDEQLTAIGDSDGIVGVTFDVSNIRPDGNLDAETDLGVLVDHIEYIIDHVGIDNVGFGSDFDGATIPNEITDVAGLPRLIERLSRRGYTESETRKITMENWLRVLDETWR